MLNYFSNWNIYTMLRSASEQRHKPTYEYNIQLKGFEPLDDILLEIILSFHFCRFLKFFLLKHIVRLSKTLVVTHCLLLWNYLTLPQIIFHTLNDCYRTFNFHHFTVKLFVKLIKGVIFYPHWFLNKMHVFL